MNHSPAGLTTSQISVGATATLLSAASSTKITDVIEQFGTTEVFIGGANVTTANGLKLPGTEGASLSIDTAGALYGITASGTQTVGVLTTSR